MDPISLCFFGHCFDVPGDSRHELDLPRERHSAQRVRLERGGAVILDAVDILHAIARRAMFGRCQNHRLQTRGALGLDNTVAAKSIAAKQRHRMIENVQDFHLQKIAFLKRLEIIDASSVE